MLVSERRGRGAVAHAVHQLAGAGAGCGSEGVAGVPEVVEAQALDPDGAARCPPLDRPVGPAQRRTFGAREDQRVGLRADVGGEVSLELRDQRRRNRDRAPAGVGLRRAEEQRARDLDERFGDRDRGCCRDRRAFG